MAEPEFVKIKTYSAFTGEKPIEEMGFLEGGDYIDDFLKKSKILSCRRVFLPERAAKAIMADLKIRLGNKSFVRIDETERGDVHTFLYLHDFQYYLYSL